MEGVVFDIRRFSTHDGQGLRTCVFLKGCPLRCIWCQNPEGLDARPAPVWFSSRCIGCGACEEASHAGGARMRGRRVVLDAAVDEDWDAVMDACPTGALRWDARRVEAGGLVSELERDRIFFREGGGVTLTGGEPLAQAAFSAELLRLLRERGIHTAIETSLAAPAEAVRRVLPLVDQIFCDYKLFDAAAHRRLTGAGNRGIRENLAWLLASPMRSRVTVRTPLIPAMTATTENLSAIAADLVSMYPDVRCELLNYNPLAAAKYRGGERVYCFPEEGNPRPYSAEQMGAFGEVMAAAGMRNLVLGL